MNSATFFASPAKWRAWLTKHHDSKTECLVGFVKVTTGESTMSWSESVDQALCFGWIDGVRRRIDDRTYSIRFTPRKPGSNWSAVNVRKITELEAAGLMSDAGRAAFAQRSEAKTAIYAYEIAPVEFSKADAARFEAEADAWAFWLTMPPSYRRSATNWVVSAKREETHIRRLEQLLVDCRAGRRLRHLNY